MHNDRTMTVKDKMPATIIMGLTAATFLVLGVFLGRRTGDGNSTASDVHAHTEAINDNHGDESVDVENQICEHDIRIIDCDECRYEAGVVKVEPSIAESLIETGTVEDVNRTMTLQLTGQVQLDSTKAVEVVSTGSGRVEEVKRLLGEKVKKGDVLATIHSADLGQAKADFLEIQARSELAQATFRREKGLYEQKITSEADYLDALNDLKSAEASLAAADRRLRLFGLGSEQIKGVKDEKENKEFANLILRAPQDGTILSQNISLGKMVDTTGSLYTIAELSNLWVWCDVYEKELAALLEQFDAGNSLAAKVQVKAFPSTAFDGVVDFVGNLMDEHTRTVKVRVQVKNPEMKLRPGMFADVVVAIPLPERMLAVPQTAIMSDAGKDFVFEQWKNDMWIRRDVTAGDKYGSLVEILGGIPKGATIATGGAFMLKSDILREKMGAGCAD
jgi:cobalt-zinc-cadmium efflux system membrane fusion protein